MDWSFVWLTTLHVGVLAVRDFFAQHFDLAVIAAFLLVVIVVPWPVKRAIWSFFTATLAGQIIMVCLLTAWGTWHARGYVDDAAMRRRDLAAQIETAKRAEAQAKLVISQMAELRRHVAASDYLLAQAKDRDETNEAALASYQQRELDYEAALAKAPAAPSCNLDAADISRMLAAAGAYRPGVAPGPAPAARKLWPAGRYP